MSPRPPSPDAGRCRVAVCIMGPTASGKTDLALALAHRADVALISVDSAMVYRGMDIGTAKPDAATLAHHPHALIDVRHPAEPFSAADFVAGADTAVLEALGRGKLPVLVGGTMLYFKAFRDGLSSLPSASAETRAALADRAAAMGWPALHDELARIDPAAAQRIHPNDPQRIQRALEVAETTGRPLSEWHRQAGVPVQERLGLTLLECAIKVPREALAERIGVRFDAMLERGFLEEVRRLRTLPGVTAARPSMRAVGYRQLWRHLDGDWDLPTARQAAITATRQLAKRQRTWLNNWPRLETLTGSPDAMATRVVGLTAGRRGG